MRSLIQYCLALFLFCATWTHAGETPPKGFSYLTWEQVHQDTQALAKKLKSLDKKWNKLVVITRGGLIPGGIISHELKIKDIDTISIASYSDLSTQQRQLKVLKELRSDRDDILVIDELSDSGATLKAVREMMPNSHIAVLYAQKEGAKAVDTYLKDAVAGMWLVFPWEKDPQSVKS